MRAVLCFLVLGLGACDGGDNGGGEGEACPAGVELGEADAGCTCGEETFELLDNGELCSCEGDGLLCETYDSCRSEATGCG